MKKLKKSFLFFLLGIVVLPSFSQNNIDSLSYYSELAQKYVNESDLNKSYLFFDKYLKLAIEKEEKDKIAYCLSRKASIELNLGFYDDSEINAIEALKVINEQEKSNYLDKIKISLFNHLGILYKKQENLDKAFNLYKEAFRYAKTQSDSIILFNNISNVYKEKKEFNKALPLLKKTYEKAIKVNDSLILAMVVDNLGVVKSKINKKDGLHEMLQALEIRKKKEDPKLYTSYSHLSAYYKENGEQLKAKVYALKSLELAKELNNSSYLQNSLGLLVELGSDTYSKEYKKITDSINSVTQNNTNKFALLKYDKIEEEKRARESELKARESELKAREKELEAESKSKKLLSYQFLVVFVASSSLVGYFFYREKNKKKVVENVIQTEGRISKTVHDVIANDIYQIMVKLQGQKSSTTEILDDLDMIYHKARDISRNNYVIDDTIDFAEILQDLVSSYQNKNLTVITNHIHTINWQSVNIHKKNMVYRALKELMTNMNKYSRASLVTIAFEEKGNKVSIIYKDNGVGCTIVKRNGLVNAENRIKSVGGHIIFESAPNKGFKCKITI
ncbi:tetratricopeptide repeat-containing sensor histidine kinase [Tenacibaculum sp. TC6]|uniref:tetratricopeptide repeat-containing sensor histidine kinase n=1 Tax=Tenacibaculum sp. TC6 TaxID=3423223 RepID=UPI003D35C017